MADLTPRTPCDGLLPLEIGAATLDEIDAGSLTALSPLGDAGALAAALEKAHGLSWPTPGRATGSDAARCLWFGHRTTLLMGPAPDAALAESAALVDQSDGWAALRLSGPAAVDVLARLVPVDLRPAAFPSGASIRTELFHMSASITKTGPEAFMILVFRSMAVTVVHDLKGAMQAVAARSRQPLRRGGV